MLPPLESGLAYDNLDQYNMAETVLCQLKAEPVRELAVLLSSLQHYVRCLGILRQPCRKEAQASHRWRMHGGCMEEERERCPNSPPAISAPSVYPT